MRCGSKIDHERDRTQIVNCCLFSLGSDSQYCWLKFGSTKLAVSLPYWNQPNAGCYQVSERALQKRGQSQGRGNVLSGCANSEDDRKDRRNSEVREQY